MIVLIQLKLPYLHLSHERQLVWLHLQPRQCLQLSTSLLGIRLCFTFLHILLQTLLVLEETTIYLPSTSSNIMALLHATLKLLHTPSKVISHLLSAEEVASQLNVPSYDSLCHCRR